MDILESKTKFEIFSIHPQAAMDAVQKTFHVVCNCFLMDQYNFSFKTWPPNISWLFST